MSEYHLPRLANQGQRLAIRADAGHVLVSAGAGTGKTWTLVHRVMRLLHDGVALPRLAAITFTQKAAAELQVRVAEELGRHRALRDQRFLLPHAQISTIDSFCARLLRERAVEAGVDPAFAVLASPQDELIQTEILDDLFHHWYRGRPSDQAAEGSWEGVPREGSAAHHEFLRLLELCGFRGGRERLRDELTEVMRTARVQGDPEAYLTGLAAGLAAGSPAASAAGLAAGLAAGSPAASAAGSAAGAADGAISSAAPPYFAVFRQQLIARYHEMLSRIAGVIEYAERVAPERKYDKMRAGLDALCAAPAPWGQAEGPGKRATEEPPSESATAPAGNLGESGHPGESSGLVAELADLRDYLQKSGLLKPGTGWALSFARVATGSPDLVKHGYERARKLFSDKTSPWQLLPQRVESMSGEYAGLRSTLKTVLTLVRQLMERYERYKAERGLLDFSDLEIKTLAMLTCAPADLRRRYDALLVDEAQDLNRLQASIVGALEPSRGRYLVGDVKQCIYQFRRAEPDIFKELFQHAAPLQDEADLEAMRAEARVRILLGENFRSQAPVLEFVNLLFADLFAPELIGTAYESQALRPPESAASADGCASIALHVLADLEGQRVTGERKLAAEARFVARRIRTMVDEGLPVRDKSGGLRPVRYGDIAVLLRSPKSKGLSIAQGLRAEGIPVSHAGQPLFEREEIRALVNLARLLGNAHDDIGLAATLCGPVGGFSHDDLTLLRLAWPESLYLVDALRATATGRETRSSGPGHPGVLEAGPAGPDLSARSAAFIERLERWRIAADTIDLSDALMMALDESGYLTRQLAASDARERMANIELVLGKIRQHAAERGHTLTTILRHLDDLVNSQADLCAFDESTAQTAAVQILSLHKSKGLEFPVVVLAHLGNTFVEQDLRSDLLTGDEWLGTDHFEPRTLVKTPTIARHALKLDRRRRGREEELRILYVALTRAQDHLVLTGCASRWENLLKKLAFWRAGMAPSQVEITRMSCPLDWIMAVLARHCDLSGLAEPTSTIRPRPHLTIHHHALPDVAAHADEPPVDPAVEALRAVIEGELETDPVATRERLQALAANEEQRTRGQSAQVLEICRRHLPAALERAAVRYPHEAATIWRSKYWVTEIKRLIDQALHEEERTAAGAAILAPSTVPVPAATQTPAARPPLDPGETPPAFAFISSPATPRDGARAEVVLPAREGTYLHAVLAELDLTAGCEARTVTTGPAGTLLEALVMPAAARLAEAGEIPRDWVRPENLQPVAAFLESDLGLSMRAHADSLEREVHFSLRAAPGELAEIWPQATELSEEEWLLIQGQIDAFWRGDSERAILVDFKSDRVSGDEQIAARAEGYRPQMQLYRLALVHIWHVAAPQGWLYFLRPRAAVRVF